MSGISPLHSSLAIGNSEIAKMLINNGAQVNLRSLSERDFKIYFFGKNPKYICLKFLKIKKKFFFPNDSFVMTFFEKFFKDFQSVFNKNKVK